MRFGLFGTGPWAHEVHAPALAEHAGTELVGVWGRNPAKAAELAGEHGAKPYSDVDALLADVDAIAVALPPDVQAGIALKAARAGKHLLLDKPVAFTVEEAERIAAAARASKVAGVVFFTRRFMPPIDAFLTEAAGRDDWLEARVDHFGSIFQPGNPFGESPWRRQSGGLWDVGPHAVALVLPVLGPVAQVTALPGAHGTTHVLLRHRSGAVSTLALSVDAPAELEREHAAFYGESGVASPPSVRWEPTEPFSYAIDQLLAAAAGGSPSRLGIPFGVEVVAILAAAADSIENGRTVTL